MKEGNRMGVYIKSMEISEDHACVYCRLSTKTSFDTMPFCDVTMKDIPNWNKRPDWCPLIPISDHGDLIDRDALLKKHYGRYGIIDEVAREAIKNMPVIISADKGKNT